MHYSYDYYRLRLLRTRGSKVMHRTSRLVFTVYRIARAATSVTGHRDLFRVTVLDQDILFCTLFTECSGQSSMSDRVLRANGRDTWYVYRGIYHQRLESR